jgi:hypothetical protein
MVIGRSSVVRLKTESPPSVGTRGDSRGATQVNAIETKIPVVMQQGGRSQRHSFQVRHIACVPSTCGYTLAL